jgi:hypothetical protein
MATTPMIAPDGTSGDIPAANMQAAQAAGFKPAVMMVAPDGKTTGYIPADQVTNATKAGFKSQKFSASQATGGSFDAQVLQNMQGRMDQAMQAPPVDTQHGVGGFLSSVGSDLGAGAARLATPLVHPFDTLRGVGEAVSAGLQGPTSGAFQDLAAKTIKPFIQNPSGEAVAAIPQAALALAGGGEVPAATKALEDSGEGGGILTRAPAVGGRGISQYIRPTSSPTIVAPAETAARNLSAAILPATKDATDFIGAAQQEVPNVLDYAKRTGNPLNTQLEFSKAAQGNAQEVRNFYTQDVLGPVQNKVVKTTGTGFGSQSNEGPDTYSTLGEIDQRVVEINKQLDKPSLNVEDQRRALASKADLQNEASGLRNILHQNLSDATGIPPDQIAALRQRVGASYELANDTNAAVTARTQAAGKTDMAPILLSQIPSQAVELSRGGSVAIADRAFQKAITNFPGDPTPLPTIKPPVAGMTPPTRPGMAQALGGGPTQPPSATMISPDAQLNAMNNSLGQRGVAVQASQTARAQAAAQAAERTQQLMELARQRQAAAVASRARNVLQP